MSNTSNNPHAWLGLLKWSLSYTDGTKPSPSADNKLNPLSEEDIKFLENVMKDGIVDETKRINEILNIFISYLENKIDGKKQQQQEKDDYEIDDDTMIDLLWELRDLIGLIDYSKVFVTIGGLPFLIGCISQTKEINKEIRSICLVLLSTLCQNNPFVQSAALEIKLPTGGEEGQECNIMDRLLQLFLLEDHNNDTSVKSRIIQSLSCIARGNTKAEDDMCSNTAFISIVHDGIRLQDSSLQKRCIFILQALLCSDTTSYTRIATFNNCINYIIESILLSSSNSSSLEIREISLQFIHTILSQKVNVVHDIYAHKDDLLNYGTNVINTEIDDEEEKERLSVECNLWKDVVRELQQLGEEQSNVIGDVEEEQQQQSEPTLMIGAPPSHDTFAQ